MSINDFNLLAANFCKTIGQTWLTGNFDYDGGVSINDFSLLVGNLGRILPVAVASSGKGVASVKR